MNKKPYLFYIVMYLFCFLSYYLFTNPEWSDITRSIESAEEMKGKSLTFTKVIIQGWESQLDFIYPLLRWIFVSQLGIDQVFLLSLILFFFFYTICEILRRHQYITKGYDLFLFYILFSCPFIFIHGITRNLLAITFLYYAYYYVEKNIKWSVFFTILSITTHITIVSLVVVFVVSILLSKLNLNSGTVRIVLLLFLLISLLFPNLLLGYISQMSQFMADQRGHYTYYSWVYTTSGVVEGIFNSSNLNYGIKIPVAYTFFFAIMLLLLKTRKDISYWMLYISVILFSFIAQCTVTLAERYIMFFPLLMGILVFSFCKEESEKNKTIVQILCYLGLLTVLIHFYSIRMYFPIP